MFCILEVQISLVASGSYEIDTKRFSATKHGSYLFSSKLMIFDCFEVEVNQKVFFGSFSGVSCLLLFLKLRVHSGQGIIPVDNFFWDFRKKRLLGCILLGVKSLFPLLRSSSSTMDLVIIKGCSTIPLMS